MRPFEHVEPPRCAAVNLSGQEMSEEPFNQNVVLKCCHVWFHLSLRSQKRLVFLHTDFLGSIKIALAGPAANASIPAMKINYSTLYVFLAFRLRKPRRPPHNCVDQKYDMRMKEKPEVASPRGRPSLCNKTPQYIVK